MSRKPKKGYYARLNFPAIEHRRLTCRA